jgi:hypothetical protein
LVSLGHAKKLITKTEEYFTEKSINFTKEWSDAETREAWLKLALNSESCQEFAELLVKLDDGMT